MDHTPPADVGVTPASAAATFQFVFMRRNRSPLRPFTARLESLEGRAALAADFYLQPPDQPAQIAVVDDASQTPPLTTLANAGFGWSDVSYVQSNFGLTGSNQTIAVIDSGVAWNQTALGGGFGPGYRVVGGYDFAENDASPFDDGPAGYHGTHVAGIIGANDASNMGLAPNADIVALRVFNDQGEGYFSWVELALRWVHKNRNAFANPITTVNLSMGAEWNSSSIPSWATMEDELTQLKADGITVCVAAGNSFSKYFSQGLAYPAASPNVMPVASVNQSGSLSSFSQRDQRVIAAPGEFVRSTVPDSFGNNDGVNYDWGLASGTSMATPFMAGASALVRQAMRQFGNTNITPDAIFNQLYNTADIIYDSTTNASFHRVNLRRAIENLAGADDFGNATNTANAIGTWQGARTVDGRIQSVSDQDYFRFTAGQSGTLKLTLQSAAGQNVAWAGAFGGSLSGNQLTLQVVAGQSYTVGLGGALGSYKIAGELSGSSTPNVNATNWGAVDFRELSGIRAAGEQWYSFTASRTGIFTAEAFFQAQLGNVDLELYNDSQQSLAASRGTGGSERVDAQVNAGTKYLLKVVGVNNSVNLRLTNLVSQTGGVLDVYGTGGADTVVWNGVAANAFVLNGVSYSGFTSVTSLNFHLGEGQDSATFLGSSASENATLRPGTIALTNPGFSLSGDGIETVRLYGQTSDQVQFNDSVGNDLFDASATAAMMRGAGYANYTEGFANVTGNASGGNDVAKLYDSAGNDTFDARPTQGILRGPGYQLVANQFDAVIAIGGRGGNDNAQFYDSPGNDTFTAGPTSATLQGPGYYLSAERFRSVRAFATAGGVDTASVANAAGEQVGQLGTFRLYAGESLAVALDTLSIERTRIENSAIDAAFATLEQETVPDNSQAPMLSHAVVEALALSTSAKSGAMSVAAEDRLFAEEEDWT